MGKRTVNVTGSIKRFLARITQPIRSTKAWQFLRRTILRSPFRGYFVKSWQELKKVTWPNRKTSWKLTLVVLIFSAAFAVFTATLDYGFENLAKKIFLN